MTPPSDLERRTLSLGTNVALSAVGGCLDAFTYVGHGRVFANAMTGNVVLLAVHAAGRQWDQALRHVPPLVTFLIGVASVRVLGLPRLRALVPERALIVLAIEIAAFFSLAWLPPASYNFLTVIVICFVASLQTATFRQINQVSYNSTFTTGNLRTLSESFFDWAIYPKRPEARKLTRDFAAICAAFFLGALAGGLLTPVLHNKVLLLVTAALAGVLIHLIIARSPRPPAESTVPRPASASPAPPARSGRYL